MNRVELFICDCLWGEKTPLPPVAVFVRLSTSGRYLSHAKPAFARLISALVLPLQFFEKASTPLFVRSLFLSRSLPCLRTDDVRRRSHAGASPLCCLTAICSLRPSVWTHRSPSWWINAPPKCSNSTHIFNFKDFKGLNLKIQLYEDVRRCCQFSDTVKRKVVNPLNWCYWLGNCH